MLFPVVFVLIICLSKVALSHLSIESWNSISNNHGAQDAEAVKGAVLEYLSISTENKTSIYDDADAHRYILSLQRHLHFNLQQETSNIDSTTSKDRVVKVESVSPSTTYATIFETYMTKNRVFSTKAYTETTNHAVDFGQWKADDSAWLAGLQNSSSITHVIPPLLLNDYTRRIPQNIFSDDLKTIFGDYAGCFGKPCRISVSDLQGATRQRVFRCPMGAHTILFDPQEISNDDSLPSTPQPVDIVLYEQRSITKMDSEFHIKPVETTSPAYDYRTLYSPLLDSTLSWQLRQDFFLRNVDKESVSTVANMNLGEKELVYIPRHLFVTVNPVVSSADPSRATTLCMMCLLDATNFNVFRSHLQALAPVSAAHDRLYTFVSPARSESATLMTAGGLSLTMDRVLPSPTETPAVTVHDFIHKYATQKDTSENKSNNIGEASSTEGEAATTAVNRKDRRRQRNKGSTTASATTGASSGGGNDFKSWQNQVQWKILMDSFLLPPTSTVDIPEIGRSHFTIRFNHSFLLSEDDKTNFGFHLVLCRWREDSSGLIIDDNLRLLNQSSDTSSSFLLRPTSSLTNTDGNVISTTRDPNLLCEERQEFIFGQSEDALGGNPSTTYAPKMIQRRKVLVPSTRIANPSSSSAAGAELDESAPSSRLYEDLYVHEWKVHHLLPVSRYQFKLAMVYGNKRGPYTSWSRRIQTSTISAPETPRTPSLEEIHTGFNPETPFFPVRDENDTFPIYNPSSYSQFLPAKIDIHDHRLQAEVLIRKEDDDGGRPVLGYVVYQLAVPYSFLQNYLQDIDMMNRLYFRHGQEISRFEESLLNEMREEQEQEHQLQLFLGELLLRQLADTGKIRNDLDEVRVAEDAADIATVSQSSTFSWRCLGAFPYEKVMKRGMHISGDLYVPEESMLRRVLVPNLRPDIFYAYKVRSFNDHGISAVSSRSVFLSWEIHRWLSSSISNAIKFSDELLINENSSIIRRMVFVPTNSSHAAVAAAKTASSSSSSASTLTTEIQDENEQLLKRFLTTQQTFHIFGRGHPNAYGKLTWSYLPLLTQLEPGLLPILQHNTPPGTVHDLFLHRYAFHVQHAQQVYNARLLSVLQAIHQQFTSEVTEVSAENMTLVYAGFVQNVLKQDASLQIDIKSLLVDTAIPLMSTETSLIKQEITLYDGRLIPWISMIAPEQYSALLCQFAPEEIVSQYLSKQVIDVHMLPAEGTVVTVGGGHIVWKTAPSQIYPVWANHFSLYHVFSASIPQNQEQRQSSDTLSIPVHPRKLIRSIPMVAEPCFLVPHRHLQQQQQQKEGSIRLSAGLSATNKDDKDNETATEATASDKYAYDVDISWYFDASSSDSSSSTSGAASVIVPHGRCDGRTAFIERGPLALYELALVAQAKGAMSVVIYDTVNGRCEKGYTQRCVPGGNVYHLEGFAAQDMPVVWHDVSIPVVMMKRSSYESLRTQMTQIRREQTQSSYKSDSAVPATTIHERYHEHYRQSHREEL